MAISGDTPEAGTGDAQCLRRGTQQMVQRRVDIARRRAAKLEQGVTQMLPARRRIGWRDVIAWSGIFAHRARSEEHTSELQSLMRISYAVFCLKKKNTPHNDTPHRQISNLHQ